MISSEQGPCLEATLMGVVAHWRALVRLSEQQDASDDALGHPLAHWFLFTWGLFTACNRRQSELGRSEFESGEVVQKNEGDASLNVSPSLSGKRD